MTPRWIGSPNFTPGRGGDRVRGIVVHIIEGSLASCDSWFRNPASKVSAHYGIGPAGEVHQYVREEDTAWHAGRVFRPTWEPARFPRVNPNRFTIGIEHHGYGSSVWSTAQYVASVALAADLCLRHDLPPSRETIVGHREIYAHKTCPGEWLDLDRYVREVGVEYGKRMPLLNPAGLPLLRRRANVPDPRGVEVALVQTILGVDGPDVYGPRTEEAVRAFQRTNGLDSDGIVGPRTWAALLRRRLRGQ